VIAAIVSAVLVESHLASADAQQKRQTKDNA